MNITFFDACKGTIAGGEDALQFDRFICSQTIVMALEGVPAFYIHSLLGTPNDHEGVAKTEVNRAINRHRWDYPQLRELLEDGTTIHARTLNALKERIAIRTAHSPFNPNATQFTMQLGDDIFGVWRQSRDRSQSIFAMHNVTDREVDVPLTSINLIDGEAWWDILTGQRIDAAAPSLHFAPYQCRWISNRP